MQINEGRTNTKTTKRRLDLLYFEHCLINYSTSLAPFRSFIIFANEVMMLSTSPRDVQSFLEHDKMDDDDDSSNECAPSFLKEFLRDLPFAIRQRKKELSHCSSKDPITALFE